MKNSLDGETIQKIEVNIQEQISKEPTPIEPITQINDELPEEEITTNPVFDLNE